MLHAICDRCGRDYALNPHSRWRAACPRCGMLLRPPADRERRRSARRKAADSVRLPVLAGPAAGEGEGQRGRAKRGVPITGAACVCLGLVPLLAGVPAHLRRPVALRSKTHFVSAPAPQTPSAVMRRQAGEEYTRARQEANQVLNSTDAPEVSAPWRAEVESQEGQRQQLMAADRGGHLRRAHAEALQALALARTAGDRYETAELLAGIEFDLGHRPAMLAQARSLVRLAPREPQAWVILEHAAERNGQNRLAHQAEAALAALVARGRAPTSLTQTGPQTAFEAAFAQAQRNYLGAQVVAKQQLEALEEQDADSSRGSDPEGYRRGFIARTQEIGAAEAAAREAARQARTNDETYRADRLLLHVEHDLGHRSAELGLAKELVALRPHDSQARLLLADAARGSAALAQPPH